jgi:PHD/YefM family antitoxin component YafN of YafNO toxin-antitoxin module
MDIESGAELAVDLSPRIIAARELKRRGIAWLDRDLAEGPVHVIRNDKLAYVIMSEAQYRDLLEDVEIATAVRIKESLQNLRAGRARTTTAEELIRELGLRD